MMANVSMYTHNGSFSLFPSLFPRASKGFQRNGTASVREGRAIDHTSFSAEDELIMNRMPFWFTTPSRPLCTPLRPRSRAAAMTVTFMASNSFLHLYCKALHLSKFVKNDALLYFYAWGETLRFLVLLTLSGAVSTRVYLHNNRQTLVFIAR